MTELFASCYYNKQTHEVRDTIQLNYSADHLPLPLLARTAGDMKWTISTITTGLVQGGTASPELFRFLIDYIYEEFHEAKDEGREPENTRMEYPGKLVSNDVILVARTAEEMQVL